MKWWTQSWCPRGLGSSGRSSACHKGNGQRSRSGIRSAICTSHGKAVRGRLLGTPGVKEGLAWTPTKETVVGILWVCSERGSTKPKCTCMGHAIQIGCLPPVCFRTDFCRFALYKGWSISPMLVFAFIFVSPLWKDRNIISYALNLWALLNPHEDHQGKLYILQFL